MKRFYIKRVSNHISIIHRKSHQPIWMGETNEEGKEVIEKFIGLTTKAFYKELNKMEIKFRLGSLEEEVKKEDEEWYEGAWKSTTKQVLELLKIKEEIPEEEFPREYIRGLQQSKTIGWGSSRTEEEEDSKEVVPSLKKLKKSPQEEETNKAIQLELDIKKEAPKKLVVVKKLKPIAKPKKIKKLAPKREEGHQEEDESLEEIPYKNKNEVREAYSGGEIDLDTYKKYMRVV